jgi:ATP-dependent DNA helicase RecG
MPESQNVEYKESWQDEYQKVICGFANASGGTLFIGIDDKGKIIGIPNYKRLMDDIPSKVRSTIGITIEVNLLENNSNYYIEIITPSYSIAISYNGKYYFRSGSTTILLTGPTLTDFLLKKGGKTWDDLSEPNATYSDIDRKSLARLIDASKESGREIDVLGLDLPQIFEKLHLVDNGKIKRAALILFGKDPGKFFPNTFVKIGRFGKNSTDLLFQEIEEGNLVTLFQNIINQLNHKFLIRNIEYDGLQRVESLEYPSVAIREMLLNALIHRNYMGAPTQIRVYDHKIEVWNDGLLPDGFTIETIKIPHSSKPRNPIIADVCFRAGYIESWGRGTLKIIESCLNSNLPEPELVERGGGFVVTLFKNELSKIDLNNYDINKRQIKALEYIKIEGKISNKIYQEMNSCSRNTASHELAFLVKKGVLISNGIRGAGAFYILK